MFSVALAFFYLNFIDRFQHLLYTAYEIYFQFKAILGGNMSKFIIILKNKYEQLSKTEKKIADFLLGASQDSVPLHIKEFAKISGSSEATIVRFAKKLGFSGYQQLKIAIAQNTTSRPVNQNITPSDTPHEIFSKVCEDIYCSLEKTKSVVSAPALLACCEAILSANRILIVGLGNSASVAIDMAHKFLRIGLNATAYTDNHMQAIAVAHTDAHSIVIGISHSGRSVDIVQALQTAKNNNAATVCITNAEKSPLKKTCDIVLNTYSDETNYRILGLSSRIAQLAIVDAIYSYLVCHIAGVEDKIASAELRLKTKKL